MRGPRKSAGKGFLKALAAARKRERDSGSGPSGLRPEGAQGEAPQSGRSDSEGIAQPTSEDS